MRLQTEKFNFEQVFLNDIKPLVRKKNSKIIYRAKKKIFFVLVKKIIRIFIHIENFQVSFNCSRSKYRTTFFGINFNITSKVFFFIITFLWH